VKFAIGDKIEIINDNEDEWASRGSKGTITYIEPSEKLANIHFYSGDYEFPGRWHINLSNVRLIPHVKRTYSLSFEK